MTPDTSSMPIFEYKAKDRSRDCPHCRNGFEHLHKVAGPPLEKCPKCGALVTKLISAPALGRSKSGLDDRAKQAGFSKLKRLGKGEYEKQY